MSKKKASDIPDSIRNYFDLLNVSKEKINDFLVSYTDLKENSTSEAKLKSFYSDFVKKSDERLKRFLFHYSHLYRIESLKRLAFDIKRLTFVSDRMDSERQEKDDQKFLVNSITKLAKKRYETSSEETILQFRAAIRLSYQRLKKNSYSLIDGWNREMIINDRLFVYAVGERENRYLPTSYLQISEKGFYKPQLSFFDEICLAENIEAARVRVCPVCRNFFWLKDFKFRTCGDKKCVQRMNYLQKKRKKMLQEFAASEFKQIRDTDDLIEEGE